MPAAPPVENSQDVSMSPVAAEATAPAVTKTTRKPRSQATAPTKPAGKVPANDDDPFGFSVAPDVSLKDRTLKCK